MPSAWRADTEPHFARSDSPGRLGLQPSPVIRPAQVPEDDRLSRSMGVWMIKRAPDVAQWKGTRDDGRGSPIGRVWYVQPVLLLHQPTTSTLPRVPSAVDMCPRTSAAAAQSYCAPTAPSQERRWKPSTSRVRISSRPHPRETGGAMPPVYSARRVRVRRARDSQEAPEMGGRRCAHAT